MPPVVLQIHLHKQIGSLETTVSSPLFMSMLLMCNSYNTKYYLEMRQTRLITQNCMSLTFDQGALH